jgi:hypothetical protein
MDASAIGDIAKVLIGLSVLVLIFLICREIVCWYWKINESIAVLKEIRDQLRVVSGHVKPPLDVDFKDVGGA